MSEKRKERISPPFHCTTKEKQSLVWRTCYRVHQDDEKALYSPIGNVQWTCLLCRKQVPSRWMVILCMVCEHKLGRGGGRDFLTPSGIEIIYSFCTKLCKSSIRGGFVGTVISPTSRLILTWWSDGNSQKDSSRNRDRQWLVATWEWWSGSLPNREERWTVRNYATNVRT